jgi:hypothetical protein
MDVVRFAGSNSQTFKFPLPPPPPTFVYYIVSLLNVGTVKAILHLRV